jgi:acyl carrier protein
MTALTVSFEQVAAHVGDTLSIPAQDLTPDTVLRDLAADSFMLVEMVVDLQERFDAMFTQEELNEVRTLGELVQLLRSAR